MQNIVRKTLRRWRLWQEHFQGAALARYFSGAEYKRRRLGFLTKSRYPHSRRPYYTLPLILIIGMTFNVVGLLLMALGYALTRMTGLNKLWRDSAEMGHLTDWRLCLSDRDMAAGFAGAVTPVSLAGHLTSLLLSNGVLIVGASVLWKMFDIPFTDWNPWQKILLFLALQPALVAAQIIVAVESVLLNIEAVALTASLAAGRSGPVTLGKMLTLSFAAMRNMILRAGIAIGVFYVSVIFAPVLVILTGQTGWSLFIVGMLSLAALAVLYLIYFTDSFKPAYREAERAIRKNILSIIDNNKSE